MSLHMSEPRPTPQNPGLSWLKGPLRCSPWRGLVKNQGVKLTQTLIYFRGAVFSTAVSGGTVTQGANK